jgi:gamma-glutamyltranspeptidase
MVVASVGPAVQAEREILGRGGNAVDAAMPRRLPRGRPPVQPGLGGGAFFVVHMAESGGRRRSTRENCARHAKTENYLG